MKELLSALRRSLTENVGYKIVTLCFAVVVWAWVQGQTRVEVRAQVPVTFVAPAGMAFVEPPIEKVTVSVEGIQAFARSLSQRPLSMTVDLAKAREGDVAVDLAERRVDGLPSQLLVTGVTPAQLRLTLDRVLKRRLPVGAATIGKVAPGFRVVSVSVQPDRAEIEGAASVMRSLDGVTTAEADIGGLRDDQEIEVALDLRKGLRSTRTERFVVRVDIEAVITERRFDAVPVVVRGEGWNAAVATVSVLLAGPEEEIGALDPGQLSVVVDVPAVRGATAEARRGRAEGPSYEVMHGGSAALKVADVDPPTIKLQRAERQEVP